MQLSAMQREWLALNEGRVLRRDQVVDLGFSEPALRALRAAGVLELVRPGVVLVRTTTKQWPQDVYKAQIRGFLADPRRRGSGPPPLAAHAAATWWGLPVLQADKLPIHVVRNGGSGRSARSRLHLVGRVPGDQIVAQGGVALTTVARSVLDVARLSGVASGIVTADAALRRALTTREELMTVADAMAGAKGAAFARTCAREASSLAESVGESLSRGRMIELSLALPRLQVPVRLRDGTTVRVDFFWEAEQKVGEFDGLLKYSARNPSGQAPTEVVIAEKRREDELRAVTAGVLRWVWSDVMRPAHFASILRTYLGE